MTPGVTRVGLAGATGDGETAATLSCALDDGGSSPTCSDGMSITGFAASAAVVFAARSFAAAIRILGRQILQFFGSKTDADGSVVMAGDSAFRQEVFVGCHRVRWGWGGAQ